MGYNIGAVTGALCSTRKEATMEPWVKRIPAAIEKTESHYDDNDCHFHCEHNYPSPTEAALAKAVWGWEVSHGFIVNNTLIPPIALRAFVEKVEAL